MEKKMMQGRSFVLSINLHLLKTKVGITKKLKKQNYFVEIDLLTDILVTN